MSDNTPPNRLSSASDKPYAASSSVPTDILEPSSVNPPCVTDDTCQPLLSAEDPLGSTGSSLPEVSSILPAKKPRKNASGLSRKDRHAKYQAASQARKKQAQITLESRRKELRTQVTNEFIAGCHSEWFGVIDEMRRRCWNIGRKAKVSFDWGILGMTDGKIPPSQLSVEPFEDDNDFTHRFTQVQLSATAVGQIPEATSNDTVKSTDGSLGDTHLHVQATGEAKPYKRKTRRRTDLDCLSEDDSWKNAKARIEWAKTQERKKSAASKAEEECQELERRLQDSRETDRWIGTTFSLLSLRDPLILGSNCLSETVREYYQTCSRDSAGRADGNDDIDMLAAAARSDNELDDESDW